VHGYDESTYGERFADVYDEWYLGISDVDATVAALVQLAAGGAVLELGIGTGRLAIPLAMTGLDVHGVDASEAMLAQLRAKPGAESVTAVFGDMAEDLPRGPFTLAFVAYNTFFGLPNEARQRACFAAVAEVLRPDGRFVIEAFVPEAPPRSGSLVEVRHLTADRVVLTASVHLPDEQRAEGQFIELTESGGVRLRPWSVRYASPDQLDEMAAGAGFSLERRTADWEGAPFDETSAHHVSVYRPAGRPILG
jgi:SAM-dependent methyltransferase